MALADLLAQCLDLGVILFETQRTDGQRSPLIVQLEESVDLIGEDGIARRALQRG